MLLGAAAGGCSNDGSGPSLPPARIDYVDGAVEPILLRGQRFVIEGFGFGAPRGSGTVRFPRANGGSATVDASVADSDWSAFAITSSVPDSAATGTVTLTVVTATGRELTASLHILPRVGFDPAGLTWLPRVAFPRAPAGVALAAAEFPEGGGLRATLFAAGGAEPFAGVGAADGTRRGVRRRAFSVGRAIERCARHGTSDATPATCCRARAVCGGRGRHPV